MNYFVYAAPTEEILYDCSFTDAENQLYTAMTKDEVLDKMLVQELIEKKISSTKFKDMLEFRAKLPTFKMKEVGVHVKYVCCKSQQIQTIRIGNCFWTFYRCNGRMMQFLCGESQTFYRF